MFVVIPTRVAVHNMTLPYALASIREHTDLTPVTVGHDTGLCELHIPTDQVRGEKFTNQELAMRTACETAWIGPEFVWSNDDIYWLRPASPIRWALGLLADDTGRTIYSRRKHDTAAILTERGLPTFDYESHTPLPVIAARMLEALTMGGTMRSVYSNLTGLPDLVAGDVKIRNRTDPLPAGGWASSPGRPTPELRTILDVATQVGVSQIRRQESARKLL